MRIIFCNTTYLRYYDGRIAGELKPATGGRWVQENEDAHEKWNFLNMDGNCYGFVRGRVDNIHIERIDKALNKQEKGENVTVVWCAKHPEEDKTVVVGWYENATVYRYDQYLNVTAVTGLDRCYQFVTKAEDAYLLPEEERTMEIGRTSKTGMGTGFGQMNYWFADSDYAKENIIPEVLNFIDEHREQRINLVGDAFEDWKIDMPFTEKELKILADEKAEASVEFLQLAYRRYAKEKSGDNAFSIAATLSILYQFGKAIEWYKEALEINPEDWEAKILLIYNCQQCERYKEAIQHSMELLNFDKAEEDDFRDEIYCLLADGYYFSGNIEEATKWQDKILEESKNKEIIEHTKRVKKLWSESK